MEIQHLKLDELKKLHKQLQVYADLSKKLGKRGRAQFTRTMDGKKLLVVEYFPSLGESYVYDTASDVYKKVFDIDPKKEDIHFIERSDIGGGIKVYQDDSMVDVSFSKIEKLMK